MKRTRALRSSAVAIAVVAIAICLAACGSSNTIDQGELESAVVDNAPASLGAESASCPEDVSSDEGTDFTCTVTTTDGEAEAAGTVTSEGEDDVDFELEYTPAGGTTGTTGPQG